MKYEIEGRVGAYRAVADLATGEVRIDERHAGRDRVTWLAAGRGVLDPVSFAEGEGTVHIVDCPAELSPATYAALEDALQAAWDTLPAAEKWYAVAEACAAAAAEIRAVDGDVSDWDHPAATWARAITAAVGWQNFSTWEDAASAAASTADAEAKKTD